MKSELTTKTIKWTVLINILLFIITTLIFYFAPYTHDDWAWGSSIGLERLETLFENYNGRWGGNLVVLLLTRCRILKAIFTSLTLTLIVYFINKIVNKDNKSLMYLLISLLFVMPVSVFAQGIAWTSGFTNYVIPVLLILIYFYLNKDLLTEGKSRLKNIMIIPLLILGFVCSLFMENLTIYNLLLSVFLIAYEFIKNRSFNKANISYFIGSVLGSVLMFSNGAYHNVVNSTDGYRSIEQGNIIIRSIKTYFDTIYKYLIQNNTILVIFIGVVVIALACLIMKKQKLSKLKMTSLCASLSIVIAYLSYIIFTYVAHNTSIFPVERYQIYFEGILAALFYISIFIIVLLLNDKNKKFRMIFILISIAIITGPLFIVNPIGPRCFFASYVFFAWFVLEVFDCFKLSTNISVRNIFLVVSICLSVFYLMIFSYIFKIETIRNEEIDKNMHSSNIVLPLIPYGKYMQWPNPTNELFEERFKLFYGIDKKTNLEFVSYKNYKKLDIDNNK